MNYHEVFELRSSAETVFDALLDEKLLGRWLAESVRIDPRRGGVFHFWGRDVIWCAEERETEGKILELDRPGTLVFSWRWKGHATRVSLSVAAVGPGSQLTIDHRFETFDAGSDGPGPDMAGSHWRIAVGNLASVLACGEPSLRPDYTTRAETGTHRVELEIEIHATPERVFRALLDPAKLRIWMQAAAPEVGIEAGRYSYGWKRGDGSIEVGPTRILELVPNRLLVHDWVWLDEPDGRVRWELSETEAGTLLRLTHVESRDLTHALGWSDALVSIRKLVEEGVRSESE